VLVGDEGPIGADDAVVPELVTQQSGNDGAVETKPDLLHRRAIGQCQPDGHAVIGHQRGGTGLDSSKERPQVVFEAPAGVNLLATVREVRVLPVALRPATGKMLGHARHAGRRNPLALKAPQIGGDQAFGGLGGLAEPPGGAGPARLGREVDLRMQGSPDSHREVFLPGDVGESLYQFRVADGAEPERLRPLGESIRGEGRAYILRERVTRVGIERDGYAERGLRGHVLQQIVPARRVARAGQPQRVEMVHALVAGKGAGRVREMLLTLHDVAVRSRLQNRHHHEAGLVIQGHPGQQVRDTLVRRQGRIFVGLHDAVAVEVAEHDPFGGGDAVTPWHR
jgi:hypothetical protein